MAALKIPSRAVDPAIRIQSGDSEDFLAAVQEARAPTRSVFSMNRKVGRAVLCAPTTATTHFYYAEDGAHGVTRPTSSKRFMAQSQESHDISQGIHLFGGIADSSNFKLLCGAARESFTRRIAFATPAVRAAGGPRRPNAARALCKES